MSTAGVPDGSTADDIGEATKARPEALRTPRGQRSRRRLVAAARTVFERAGYADARLGDITAEAGMSAGSFYTYFNSKEEVLAAVLEGLQTEMLHAPRDGDSHVDTPTAVIEASNRAYLLSYERNAQLMRLLEEVSDINPEFRALRRRRAEAFINRNARSIAELQRTGFADPQLDPYLSAKALSLMVSRVAFQAFVAGETWDVDYLVATLTRLWVNALRISAE
jgi:AcrR family transcriptional regulator